jgi:hypothetical protein
MSSGNSVREMVNSGYRNGNWKITEINGSNMIYMGG